MIPVRFTGPRGTITVDAAPGDRLLDVAQAADQPLEGTCEGAMACSTCHVIVDPADFDRLPPASDMEEDMLDLAAGATRTSRLACQIILDESLSGLAVRIPAEARDTRRR
jgi:ferredoxin